MTELRGETVVPRPLAAAVRTHLVPCRQAPGVDAWWGSGLLERSPHDESGRWRDETSMERVEKSLVDSAS